jgi:methionyl aminopeptidase
MRTGRNDLCPCGSGLKYKKCCLKKELSDPEDPKTLYYRKYGIRIKSEKDIEAMRLAGKLAVETLELVRGYIRPGVKTDDINTLVHEFTIKNGAIPAPLNYRGYPKSVCISINEVICHGIPGDRILIDGDIVNIDVTPILNGYYADANMTFLLETCQRTPER